MKTFPCLQTEGVIEPADHHEHDDDRKFLDDMFAGCEALCGDIDIENEGSVIEKRKPRASPPPAGLTHKTNHSAGNSDQKARKSMHRDTERQRRKEMASLYASLRSLLPIEYIKGKRAVTDQLNQAASYINHMQTKIGKMKMRRRDLIEQQKLCAGDEDTNKPGSNNRVTVNVCRGGMEILISSEASGALSKVFAVLLGISDELNVVSCVSTRPGPDDQSQSLLHRIQMEVNDPASCIDLSQLQKRLINVIQ